MVVSNPNFQNGGSGGVRNHILTIVTRKMDTLPDDLLKTIFQGFVIKERVGILRVAKRWKRVMEEDDDYMAIRHGVICIRVNHWRTLPKHCLNAASILFTHIPPRGPGCVSTVLPYNHLVHHLHDMVDLGLRMMDGFSGLYIVMVVQNDWERWNINDSMNMLTGNIIIDENHSQPYTSRLKNGSVMRTVTPDDPLFGKGEEGLVTLYIVPNLTNFRSYDISHKLVPLISINKMMVFFPREANRDRDIEPILGHKGTILSNRI